MTFCVFYLSFSALYGTVSDVFIKMPKQELLVAGKKLRPVSFAVYVCLAKIFLGFFKIFMIKEKEIFRILILACPYFSDDLKYYKLFRSACTSCLQSYKHNSFEPD